MVSTSPEPAAAGGRASKDAHWRTPLRAGAEVDCAGPFAPWARAAAVVAELAASPRVLGVVAMRMNGFQIVRDVVASVGQRNNMVGACRAGAAAKPTDAAVAHGDHGDDALPAWAGDAPVPASRHSAIVTGLGPKRRVTATHVLADRYRRGGRALRSDVDTRAHRRVLSATGSLWGRQGCLGDRNACRPVRRAADLHDAPTRRVADRLAPQTEILISFGRRLSCGADRDGRVAFRPRR